MSITCADAVISGDPEAIRQSASEWTRRGAALATLAVEVRVCGEIDGFCGDESVLHAARAIDLSRDLEHSAEAWRVAGKALAGYADVLRVLQHRWRAAEIAPSGRLPAGEPVASPASGPAVRNPARMAAMGAEHEQAVADCVGQLARATSLLPRHAGHPAYVRPPTPAARATSPAAAFGLPPLVDLAARLRSAAVSSTVTPAAPDGPADLWSEIADLLGWAALGLAAMGGGGVGGAAALGGEVIAGGAVAAGAAPLAAGAGVAVVLLGGALLVTAAIKGESPGEAWDDLRTTEIGGSPQVDPSGLRQIAAQNRARLPPDVLADVDKAVERARRRRLRSPRHDGEPWRNSLGQLPARPEGYYTEWDAAAPGKPRGGNRVIVGGDPVHPDAIYFWDHTEAAPVYIGP